MIDVSQWRSSIGLWYSSCQPFYCLKSSTALGQSAREQLLSSLIEILLILSGNVELNPGPKTNDVRKILQRVLREKFAFLSEAIKHCIPRTAELMYSSGLISDHTFDTNNRQSMIDEFKNKMPFKNDVSELQSHCQLFLDCLSCQGGPPLEVAQHLAKIWTERVQQELEISLSFDIKHAQSMETTLYSTSSSTATSPQMDQSTYPIMAATSPQMDQSTYPIMAATSPQMDQSTYPIMAATSPQMDQSTYPIMTTASPQIDQLHQNSTDNGREHISSGTDKHTKFSPQSRDGVSEPIAIKLLPDEEIEIKDSLIVLCKKFASLLREFREEYKTAIKNGTLELSAVIDYIQDSTGTDKDLSSCQTINDVLKAIDNSFDFLDCQVIVDTAEEFAYSELASKFQTHQQKAEELRSCLSVKALREQLHQIYKPHVNNPENAPKARIDLHTVWNGVPIKGLYKLMRRFYPGNDSLLKNIEITASSVHIKYYMTESQDEIKQIIDYCQQNVSIMRYIGIFGLEINGTIILDDQDENEHYTFEYGLLKAAEDGNNEAVQFLVELGIEVINHVTEEGQTPLTLAITNGHRHVMETLISAGANVNPQVKWTPLAIAVKVGENPLELARYLLDHGAHCNVLINGTSILDMTSHEETRQLLYQHNAAMHMTTQELIAFRYFELQDKLEELIANVRKCLNNLLSAGNIKLTEVKDQVINYISQTAGTMYESVEELLVLLQPFCSVFNVNPLKSVAEKFLAESKIMADFDDYSKNLNDFEMSTKLHHMVHVMSVASDIQPISSSVTIKFNSQWKDRPLADVRKLHEHCFISTHQFMTLTDVNEEDSKMVLMYKTPSSPQCSPVISTEQQQFMKQIGICEVIVDDVILLVNDDEQEMPLERVLQQAVDDNNDNLTSFLMDINVTISGSEPLLQHGQSSSSSSQPLIESTFTSLKKQAELLLMYAASTGDNDTVKSLLDRNIVDVNYYAEDGETPLMMAAENNHVDVIKTLLLAGASKLVNHQTNEGATALMVASQNGHLEVIKCLLTEGVDLNVQTNDGWTALMLASVNGHLEVIKCLLTEGVDINVQTNDGWTALMLASENGHLEVIKCLLTEGVDLNVQTNDGRTALMLASENGHLEVIKCLLTEGVDLNVQTNEGATALMLASENGHLEVIKCLLTEGVDLNVQTNDGRTALMFASQNGHLEVIKCLLTEGVDLNVQTNEGATALMLASENGHLEVIKRLLTEGVDLNVQTNDGRTALMLASENGHLEVIKCLLTEGVDLNVQTNEGATALMLASLNGHLEVIKCLLTEGVDLNVQTNEGATALMLASLNGHLEVIKCLLTEGVDLNVQTNEGATALMLASENGHLEVIKCLLTEGVDLNVQTNEGATALMLASLNGHLEVIKCLLTEGVYLNVQANNGLTALMLASENGHLEVIKCLLTEGVDINVQTNNGWTALMLASQNGHLEVIKCLLTKGVDLNVQTNDGWTALMLASVNGHLEVIKCLLTEGVDINVQTNNGWTALMLASQNGHLEVIKCLLTEGVDINVQTNDGRTALMLASQNGHLEVIKCLLTEGVDINVQTNDGWTALMLASQNGHLEVIKCLLTEGVDINVQTNDGRTALMLASQNGHLEVIKCLLTEGVDLNVQTNEGATALMLASQNGHLEVIKCLLTEGVYLNVQTNNGLTALMLASENGHLEVIKCLLTEGVDLNVQTNDGWTALMLASENGHLDVIKCLLTEGVDLNVQTNDGWTALMLASVNGHLEVIKCLLTEGVDINVQTNDGWTALMLASQNGHLEVVKKLLQKEADHNFATNSCFTALMLLCLTSYDACKYFQYDDDRMQRLQLHCIPMIELLLDANASPVVTHSDGRELSSLTVAAFANNLDTVNVLMRRIEFSNELITHALITACYVGNPSMIDALSHKTTNLPHKELLLSCAEGDIAGVISAIYESNPLVCGLTPLMVASSCGHVELIDALIQAGADINLPNDYGHTPLDIVDHEYDIHPLNHNVISILVEHGATHQKPVDDEIFFYSPPPNNQSIDDSSVSTQESTKPQMKLLSILSLLKSYLMNPTHTFIKKKHQLNNRGTNQPHHQTKHFVM